MIMSIRFTKMHALGNDFMVINAVHQTVGFTPKQIVELADRHTGVGFDQCLIVEKSHDPDIDFLYRIYNANGSEVGQCGNGARCLARFIHQQGLSDKMTITVATPTTRMTLHINLDQTVTVDLGCPRWNVDANDVLPRIEQINLEQHTYSFYEVDVGNPHAVILTDDLNQAPLQTVGKQLSTHPFFPHQCNIGFMNILNPDHIQCRIYERGCGETSACGSGAVAAVAIGSLIYGLSKEVTVTLPGGDVSIYWPDHSGHIFLTGSATFVYDGVLLNIS